MHRDTNHDTYLVQLLLPLSDDDGKPFPESSYRSLQEELTERFGGLTAYSRAPADGLWNGEGEKRERDDIVVYEVMTESLDRAWWAQFRERLETTFRQDEVVVRAHRVERL